MSVDLNLLEILMKFIEKNSPKYLLYLNDETFSLTSVSITNSPIPVNEPTTRGGVYFSEKFAYKMKGVIEGLSVVPLLTKKGLTKTVLTKTGMMKMDMIVMGMMKMDMIVMGMMKMDLMF